jgi:hypothetical protein
MCSRLDLLVTFTDYFGMLLTYLSNAHENKTMPKIEYNEYQILVRDLNDRIETVLKEFKQYFSLNRNKLRTKIFKTLLKLHELLHYEIGTNGIDYESRLRQIIKEGLLLDYDKIIEEVDEVDVIGLFQIAQILKNDFENNIYATSRVFSRIQYDVLAMQVYYARFSSDFKQVSQFIKTLR